MKELNLHDANKLDIVANFIDYTKICYTSAPSIWELLIKTTFITAFVSCHGRKRWLISIDQLICIVERASNFVSKSYLIFF